MSQIFRKMNAECRACDIVRAGFMMKVAYVLFKKKQNYKVYTYVPKPTEANVNALKEIISKLQIGLLLYDDIERVEELGAPSLNISFSKYHTDIMQPEIIAIPFIRMEEKAIGEFILIPQLEEMYVNEYKNFIAYNHQLEEEYASTLKVSMKDCVRNAKLVSIKSAEYLLGLAEKYGIEV